MEINPILEALDSFTHILDLQINMSQLHCLH